MWKESRFIRWALRTFKKNEGTDKGLISKIHKQLIQLNTRKKKQLGQKVGKRPKQTFLQRRHMDG